MKQLTTRSTALALAYTHLLIELWRAFLDTSFILPDYSGGDPGMLVLFAAVYALLFGGWTLGLIQANKGNRGGFVAAIIFGLFFLLGIDISTIAFYCPGGCDNLLFDVLTWGGTVVGALAIFGLWSHLRGANSAAGEHPA